MRRMASGLLAAAVILSLAGCGGGKAESGAPSSSQVESVATQPTATPAPAQIVPPDSSAGVDSSEAAPLTFKLTIPEGYTLARIGMTLEEMGVCTAAEFLDAAQTGDYSAYPLVAQQAYDENRCFKLEGYLFPETYEFYTGATADDVIRTMLDHMESRITEDLRAEIAQSGYTFDQILTLASIIEKEALGAEQMPMISSVLHNRLAAGMQLQCDVTIKYVEGAIKPFIDGDIDRYNSYYNTYKCPALPAGAICNPSYDAILAALRPETSDYYYFLTDADGNYYYAATLEEHNANRATTGV